MRDKQALDLGALAKLDIYQSETQVAERTRDLVQAQYQYRNARDALRRVIGADLTPALRATEIVLDDDPRAIPSTRVLPFEEALADALRSRPELKASGQSVSIDNLNARRYRDELLPRLDLTLQGGATGPGLNQIGVGGVVGVTPTMGYPGLGDTLHQVLAFNFPSYGFDLALRFPVHNSLAQASLADSLVNRVRDRYQQRQTQEQITLDVRQAIT
ncbi:MAG: TolC family protein [Acidobacteriota bacterium]|nr:TolC family protein [Acidobacteriota bacterium]